MAGNANFGSVLSTTLQNYRPTLEDNIFKRLPLFFYMYEKGRKRMEDGGERIVVPLLYERNSTAQSYSAYQSLDVTPQEGVTAAEYTWRQYSVSITISGREERQNMGESRVINLLDAKTKQAELSLKRVMDIDLFSTNGDSSIGLYGLQQLVDIAPTTDTVGNINRANDTWWRNNSTTSVGSFAANGLDNMRTMYNTCSNEGQDNVDILLTTQTVFEYYEKVLQVQERFTDNKMADGGFTNLKFKDKPLVFDSNCPSGYIYFLNTNYLELVVHSSADLQTSDFVKPNNQDARTAQILWMGNMVMSNAARQGILSGITA